MLRNLNVIVSILARSCKISVLVKSEVVVLKILILKFQIELITTEVKELIIKGAISPVQDNTEGFIYVPIIYCP